MASRLYFPGSGHRYCHTQVGGNVCPYYFEGPTKHRLHGVLPFSTIFCGGGEYVLCRERGYGFAEALLSLRLS